MSLLKINGVSYPNSVVKNSLDLTWDKEGGGSVSCRVLGLVPQAGQIAEVYNGNLKLWGGIITNPTRVQAGRGANAPFLYDITIASYRRLARKRMATERYVNWYAGSIVKDLFSRYAPSIDVSLVQQGPMIPEWSCNYTTIDSESAELAQAIGFIYDINENKQVIFQAAQTYPAPFSLNDSSLNFSGLTISVDTSELRNAILVRGGRMTGAEFVEEFIADGSRANYQLMQEPFLSGQAFLLQENFDSDLSTETWSEYDVPEDYMQAYMGSLQTTGGTGNWGDVGLVSKSLYERKANRRIETEVLVHTSAEFALGWQDGDGILPTDLKHGILFKADGTLLAIDDGVEQVIGGATYYSETDYRLRITLCEVGALLQIQGGAYGEIGTPSWADLYTYPTGTLENLSVATLLHKLGQVAISSVVVRDPAKGITVEVGSGVTFVNKVTGFENLDEGNGVDCVLSPQARMVRFFSDSTPEAGKVVRVRYHQPVPLIVMVSDPVSIGRVAEIEGGEGRYEYALTPDLTLETLEAARAAGKAELALYSNPLVSIRYLTLSPGLKPGMVQNINIRGFSQDVLIQSVTANDVGTDGEGTVLEYTISAGSRVKGIEDYLQTLIKQGKRVQKSDNEVLDILSSAIDLLVLSEAISVTQADRYPNEAVELAESVVVSTSPRYPNEVLHLSETVSTALLTEGLGVDRFDTMRFGYIILE